MISLTCPDVNVWLALLLEDHVHRASAVAWWRVDRSEAIVFVRFTQIAVLRLLTTPAAMNQKPLTMSAAWAAYDQLFADTRVGLAQEPHGVGALFRANSNLQSGSPKVWADAWLLAFAESAGATLVTFDQALASRAASAVLLGNPAA